MNRYQKLGVVVLVYAALGLPFAFGMMSVFIAHGFDWSELFDAILWMVLVVGGLAIVRSRPWGRWLVIVSLLGSLLGALAALLLLDVQEAPASGRLTGATGLLLLPGVALLIAVLVVRPMPATLADRTAEPSRTRLGPRFDLNDAAYLCFAWIAFVILVSALLTLLPIDFTTAQALGMIVGVPAVTLTLAISGLGIVLSLMRLREWPLPLMSFLTLTMLAAFLANDEMHLISGTVYTVWCWLCTAALTFLSIRWWFVRRRRSRPPVAP